MYVLVVSTNENHSTSAVNTLRNEGYQVEEIKNIKEAIFSMMRKTPIILALDTKLSIHDEAYLFSEINKRSIDVPYVLMTSLEETPEASTKGMTLQGLIQITKAIVKSRRIYTQCRNGLSNPI